MSKLTNFTRFVNESSADQSDSRKKRLEELGLRDKFEGMDFDDRFNEMSDAFMSDPEVTEIYDRLKQKFSEHEAEWFPEGMYYEVDGWENYMEALHNNFSIDELGLVEFLTLNQ